MTDPLIRWREHAGDAVLLDGFHALKHALRFGAEVPVAVATDRRAALALAEDLAGDVRDALDALLTEVPAEAYASLVPRRHPTGVAALAVRPSREANLRRLAHLPRTAPVVVLDNPRNLGNAGAVIRLAAGFGATGVVTTGTLDPWHPTVVRGGAGLHFATAVERLDVDELPPGRCSRWTPRATTSGACGSRTTPSSPSAPSAADCRRNCARVLYHLLSLPMRPQVSSYNLATSVAMTLYHWSAGGALTPS